MILHPINKKQINGSNPLAINKNEYWQRSVIIPYLDSLMAALKLLTAAPLKLRPGYVHDS